MEKTNKILAIVAAALSVFNVLLFYAVHAMWSGVIAILGSASPYIIIAIMFALAVLSVTLCLLKKRKLWLSIVFLAVGAFFLAVEIYIISQTADSYKFFIREFFTSAFWFALIALVIFILFYYPKTKFFKYKTPKIALVVILALSLFLPTFGLFPNRFTSTPVVYAVGDDYQIVFTTRDKGTAWAEIGGVEYNDTYAGYRTSETTVHKITVPMSALDKAGGYTLYSRAMFLRGPYSAFQGRIISSTHNWRGVNESDGINYYVVSDTHTDYNAPSKAASYFGENLDFLICAGDTSNWIDCEADCMYLLKLAGLVTNGEIPVVYARGNHETKGQLADEFYKYVGSVNQKFYFTFRLKSIWGIVLDLGEDHGDDWSEYYGASRFDDYRAEQVEFLDSVIADKENEYEAEGVEYRLAVCHMPVSFEYRSDSFTEYKNQWIDRLNQIPITCLFGGHRHQLMYIPSSIEDGQALTYREDYAGYKPSRPDGYGTHANFPSILVSRKNVIQEISSESIEGDKVFIGLAVSVEGSQTIMRFTNEKHEALEHILSPWLDGVDYGDKIILENK